MNVYTSATMIRLFGALFWFSLAVAGCNTSSPPPAPEVTGPDLAQRLCVNSHMPVDDSPASAARRSVEYEWLRQSGVTCLRLDFRWWRIEPEPEAYDFADYDRVVDELGAVGVTTIALVSSAPDWARPNGDSSIDPAVFGRLMHRLGEHFAGRVVIWELWNEPNWIFWEPEPDLPAYAALLVSGATAIRDADPNALVLSAGMLSLADLLTGAPVWSSIEALFVAVPDLDARIDGIGIHPYTWLQQWRPERNEGAQRPSIAAMLDAASALLARHHAGNLPVVNTETGWSNAIVTEDEKARYLMRAALITLAAGTQRFTAFNLTGADPEDPNVPAPAENGYGLLRWDPDPLDDAVPEPEPAGIALARLAQRLSGTWLIPETPWTSVPRGDGVFSVTTGNDDRIVRFLWTSEPDLRVPFAVTAPVGFDLVQASRIVSGEEVSVQSSTILLDDDPLILEYRSRSAPGQ